ncbi:MAG: TIGR03905 family TSCPD domain-containing protein [Spirochaetales bacterium]|nr:TIGR03905 family TSCPD domain-containing protein [Candidatus Physcosoma equi]
MYHYDYLTENTCSSVISLDLEGDKVHNISFMGGCNGNLKTIPILLEGWRVEDIEKTHSGIQCGRRETSCADQLAKAVRRAYTAMENGEVQGLDD